MKKVLLLFLGLLPLVTLSQKRDTVYCDEHGNKTTKAKVAYTRYITHLANGYYNVEEHDKYQNLIMTGIYSSLDPEIKNGYFKIYITCFMGEFSQKGICLKEQGNYKNNKREGMWYFYDGDGRSYNGREFKNGIMQNDSLTFYPNDTVKKRFTIVGGKLVKWIAYDNTGKELKPGQDPDSDKIYTMARQMPKFRSDVRKYIDSAIVYPAKEKSENITGTVYVSFLVERNGTVNSVKILRGVLNGSGLDTEAVAIVKTMTPWQPGSTGYGIPVRVQMVVPVHFNLKDQKY